MRLYSHSARQSAQFSFLLLLVGGSCSLFGPAFEQPGPDALEKARDEAIERGLDNQPFVQKHVSEEYPFIRFLRQTDGNLRALIPVPKAASQFMKEILEKNCPSLSRETDPALIDFEPGYVVGGNPALPPDKADYQMKPVEDMLVVAGTQDDIREVLEFIDLYYNSAPQIEIQAQIVEVSDTEAFERGIEDLSLLNTKGGNPYVYPRLDGNGDPIIDPNTGLWDKPTDVGVPGPFFRGFNTDFPFPSAGGGFELAIISKSYVLDAFLKMVRTVEGADIVSRPRVVVRNGVSAQLASKEQIPYQKFSTINTNGVAASTVAFLDLGVNLQVLPVLMGADTVHLSISAQVSRAGRLVAIAPDVFMPSTTDRTATTEVAVRDGQSVVIGGLMLTEMREIESHVPLLGSIPLLGWLFSYRSTESIKTEVLFVITPKIKRRASIEKFGDLFDPFSDEASQ
jgi:type II secretory pathway component GspD/PulD (secretin)